MRDIGVTRELSLLGSCNDSHLLGERGDMKLLRRALRLWGPLLQRLWPWLAFAIGTKEIVTFYFRLVADPQQDSDRILVAIALGCLQVGLAILTSVFVMVAAQDEIHGRRTDIWKSFKSHFKYLTIEGLRTILPILLRTLLLIIPGLIEYLRLSFVSYVVMLDPEYQAGKADALERSRELVKGHLLYVFLFLLLSAVIEYLGSSALDALMLSRQPVPYALSFVLAVIATAYSNILFFCIYEKLANNLHLKRGA